MYSLSCLSDMLGIFYADKAGAPTLLGDTGSLLYEAEVDLTTAFSDADALGLRCCDLPTCQDRSQVSMRCLACVPAIFSKGSDTRMHVKNVPAPHKS